MTEFTINVKVGITPDLEKLIKGVTAAYIGKCRPLMSASDIINDLFPTPEVITHEPDSMQDPIVNSVSVREAVKVPEINTEAMTEDKPKTPTAADVRAAMDEVRQRIEGTDYKNNTDSEAYKKYHKALSGMFKNEASLLGSDKPSTLPEDKRQSFINYCRTIAVDENGELTIVIPF